MRGLVLLCAALTACGPSVDGNWSIKITDPSASCSGTMTISEKASSQDLTGSWGCAGSGGTLTGTYKDPSISMTFQPSGNFNSFLITGTVRANAMTGTINGSGFQNASFSASH